METFLTIGLKATNLTSRFEFFLTADRKSAAYDNFKPNELRRVAFVGTTQAIPLIGGGILSAWMDSALVAIVAGVAAVVVAGAIGWCLHRHIPPARIEIR